MARWSCIRQRFEREAAAGRRIQHLGVRLCIFAAAINDDKFSRGAPSTLAAAHSIAGSIEVLRAQLVKPNLSGAPISHQLANIQTTKARSDSGNSKNVACENESIPYLVAVEDPRKRRREKEWCKLHFATFV